MDKYTHENGLAHDLNTGPFVIGPEREDVGERHCLDFPYVVIHYLTYKELLEMYCD
jgi:hypothetical protein